MYEYSEQKKLIDITLRRKESPKKHQGYRVYKALVYHRYFEILSNAYPLFYEIVDKKEFENLIQKFMRYGAKKHLVWKMPNEFRKFIKINNFIKEKYPFLDDLLWFEWIEVNLAMKHYKKYKQKKFSYDNKYRLNKNFSLKKLEYKVFEKENFNKKLDTYLLAYYDFGDYSVYYREVSEILYIFLKAFKKSSMQESLKVIANLSKEHINDVKAFLKPALKELVRKQILVIDNKI